MKTKYLGVAGMLGAPFLAVDFLLHQGQPDEQTSLTGVLGLLYMAGWMCSLWGLYQIGVFHKKLAKVVFWTQMGLLSVAQLYNCWVIVEPDADNTLYWIMDACWPLSNLFMLVTGTMVIRSGVLSGLSRYIPFLVGLWFPVSVAAMFVFGRDSMGLTVFSGLYSTLMWGLMGFMVVTHSRFVSSFRGVH